MLVSQGLSALPLFREEICNGLRGASLRRTPHRDVLLRVVRNIDREPEKGKLCSVWDSMLLNSVVQVNFLSHLGSRHEDATERT